LRIDPSVNDFGKPLSCSAANHRRRILNPALTHW
jgi:hypothetical protein